MGPERTRPGHPDAGDSALRARLFGGLNLQIGGVPVPRLDSARAESLLAYLLLHRDTPQLRQRLAFVLWPDSTESQARTNLRHVLHKLRRALPDAERLIEVRPRTLQWRAEAWLDVSVFERAVGDGRLEEAVELYTGDLLEGSYDEWLLEERERLAQLHVDALERLARGCEEQARWADAIRYGERLLLHDPLREQTYRLLMRVGDRAGDRARALRVYHVCAATLQGELGIEPSAATREAYEALLHVAPEPGARGREPTSAADAPLVGRTPERARLSSLWRAAERGRAQLVLVTGEAGVGKSRLVEELRSGCSHGGAVTADARAYAAEGAMAYGIVAGWLRTDPIATRLRRLDDVQLTELARVLPELLVDVGDLAAPEVLPESEQRRRLFGAAAGAILAAGAPLLLVADDLQWSDAETLQFLHYLLRTQPDARVLVAATARREEIDARHPVAELIAALQALGRITEIALERLSREETRLLAGLIAGTSLTDADAHRLFDETEGNPLFVVEASRAGSKAVVGSGAGRVQAVINSRLAQLSEPAGELVGVAATIGREFTTTVLAAASRADEPVFVRALDELWRRGLVRAHDPDAYDFSHGKIREAAYLALSPAQARDHNLRVGRALERSRPADLDAIAGRLAGHYEAAGATDEATPWYVRAADAAQRLHSHADAVRFLERALELARGLPAGGTRDALELRLLTALPAPLVAVEGYLSERVAEFHARALALADALGVEVEAPLVRSLALASLTRIDFDGARACGEQLRSRGERDGDDVLWIEGAYVLGVTAYWQGRLAEARAEFEAAVARCRPDRRAVHLLRYGQDPEIVCLTRLAHTLWLQGQDDDAQRTRDTALALADASGDPYSRAVAFAWVGMLALDSRDEQRLRACAQALDSDDPAYGARQVRLAADGLGGVVDVLDGRTSEGVDRARRAVAEGRGAPAAPGAQGLLVRVLLEACALAADADTGLVAADEALAPIGRVAVWEAEARRLRAEFLLVLGAAVDEVEAEMLTAVEVAQHQCARPFELRARASLDRLHAGTLRQTLGERWVVDHAAHEPWRPTT